MTLYIAERKAEDETVPEISPNRHAEEVCENLGNRIASVHIARETSFISDSINLIRLRYFEHSSMPNSQQLRQERQHTVRQGERQRVRNVNTAAHD